MGHNRACNGITSPFFILLLNQRWSPLLTFQVSDCSTFRILCIVPSIANFYGESVECFPDMALKYLSVLSHISCSTFVVYLFKNSCIFLLPDSPVHWYCYLSSCSFSSAFLFLIFIFGLFAITFLSVCTPCFSNTVYIYSLGVVFFILKMKF